MKLTCEMMTDLLPLYRDDVCSPDSRRAAEAHLAECPACRQTLRLMEGELSRPQAPQAELDLKRFALQARKRVFFRGVLAALALMLVFAGAVAGWHWIITLPESDREGLARQAADYLGGGPLQIEQTERRGDYLAALCLAQDGRRAICIFDRDRLFSDRWYANGGAYWMEPGELGVWNYGSPTREAVLVIGGGDLPAEADKYTFTRDGIIYLCPIQDSSLLDLFIIPDGRGGTGTPPQLLDAAGKALD